MLDSNSVVLIRPYLNYCDLKNELKYFETLGPAVGYLYLRNSRPLRGVVNAVMNLRVP
jgi:hypothetical protein